MAVREQHKHHIHPYGDGEAFPSGQGGASPAPDRRQSAGRRALDGVSPDRLLHSGLDTVIRKIESSPLLNAQGEASDSGLLNFTFTVQIGRVLYKNPRDLSDEEKKLGIWAAAELVPIPQGKHAGDMLVLPISAGPSSHKKYLIDITGTTGSREVDLRLYVNDSAKEVVNTATIPASWFTNQGFDLNPINPHNHGKTLRPNLTRSVFYPFLLGEGMFAQQKQLADRSVEPQPSSKDLLTSLYDIPAIVEANNEAAYLNLMGNYFTLSLALAPQSRAEKLEKLQSLRRTAYHDGDSSTRREMEADLKMRFYILREVGFAQTLDLLTRFKNDAGESEDEVYHFKEMRRVKFHSTKEDRKMKMVLTLIDEKRRLAVENLQHYIDTWKALFPVGPRTNFWLKRVEHAPDDLRTRAEISEGLRNELGKKLITQFHDYSEQWQISSVDLGMPAKEAEEKTHQRIDTFRSSPLSVKAGTIKDIEIGADDTLLAAFSINVRIWNLLTGGEQGNTVDQINNAFNDASTEGKIRLARKLFIDTKQELEKTRKTYGEKVYLGFRKRGLLRGDAIVELHETLKRLTMLPRLEQLRIMSANELV